MAKKSTKKTMRREAVGEAIALGEQSVAVKDLNLELQSAITEGTWFIEQCSMDYQTRNCVWAGQSPDGRKHQEQGARPVFPWDNASDTRIRLVEEVIGDNVRVNQAALKRTMIQATAFQSLKEDQAAAVSTWLRWLVFNQMADDIRREIPLLAQWQEQNSASVLGVSWEEEARIRPVQVTLEEMRATVQEKLQDSASAEGAKEAAAMLDMLFDETRDDDLVAWLRKLYPVLTARKALAQLNNLRTTGAAIMPQSKIVHSRPKWTALRIFRDVFFPTNTISLQKAPWVCVREPITPVDLKSRVLTNEYDDDVVEEACETKLGQSMLGDLQFKSRAALDHIVMDEMEGMVELAHFYRKVVDDQGFTKIVVTCFVPGLDDPVKEYDLDYPHQDQPFIDFVRDRTERAILENRSVPSQLATHQQEIKTQRDWRADRASITIMPPIRVPMWRAESDLVIGPKRQIPERRQNEVGWMEPPRLDADPLNLEEQVRGDANSLFARMAPGVDANRVALYQQASVDGWLGGLVLAMKQTLALSRKYKSNEDFFRVTGVQMNFELSEDEVLGDWDVLLDFNAGDLNLDTVLKKMKVLNEAILPDDTMGVADRAFIVQWAMRAVDSALAQGAVRPVEAASDSEIEGTQNDYAKIAAGTMPMLKDRGQNFALRVQTLDNIVRNNPNVQRRLAEDEVFKKMMENYRQHLSFQVEQQKNAQIGRVGVDASLGSATQQGY